MNPEAKKIKSIGVIGGGTAGYFSALYMKKQFPDIEVTLIESSKLPIIGVGEATTSLLQKFMHKYMEWPVQEIFQKVKPTLKLGIKFYWGRKDVSHYNFPFGPADTVNALYYTGDYNNNSIPAMLMEQNKAPFLKQGGKITPININKGYAYHIDNETLIAFLKVKLKESGCHHIDTEIKDAVKKPSSQEIDAVIGEDGKHHRFDLFIDCSGFRSFLLGQILKAKWVDFSGSLKTNRAVIGMQDHHGKIKPFTSATTLNHGWLWNTPTQKEDHLGYVFSKEHCSDDEAMHELRKHCKHINNEKVISFRSGRYENSWIENVVGIGNTFAFVEPLESTGLHMIIMQLRTLSKSIAANKPKEVYNQKVNDAWDNIKYFIAIHFKFNAKLDTPFWEECRTNIDVSGVQDYLDYYMEHGPVFLNVGHPIREAMKKNDLFSGYAYDGIMAASGVNLEFFQKKNVCVSDNWMKVYEFQKNLVKNAISHEEGLKYLEENPTSFIADWFLTEEEKANAAV
ncbi:MAG: tryptophan 7-halogenase [Flavobacteriales bacterium]